MSKITNGGKPSWLTWIIALGIILGVIISVTKLTDRIFNKGAGSALMAQTVKNNTEDIVEMVDTLDEVQERIKVREDNWDKFVVQQSRKALLDSVGNAAVLQLLARQVDYNEKQTAINGKQAELNDDIKEHLIKAEVE